VKAAARREKDPRRNEPAILRGSGRSGTARYARPPLWNPRRHAV